MRSRTPFSFARIESYGLCGSESRSRPLPHPEVRSEAEASTPHPEPVEGALQDPLRALEGSFEAADAAPQDEGFG